ncbi:MAG: ABC-F family ATP-binding cassette domain-containing protein [Alloprevotella sp.]|nr:ABC-F family ATP-binding cassette domain-containing protein [Alloprevotella sp.]
MLSAQNLAIEFSDRTLFRDLSFVINPKERVALVGRNGAGKSTLLKVLAGLQRPTSGSVAVDNDTTIGYLPQVMQLADDTTVRCETEKVFDHLQRLAGQIDSDRRALAERTDTDSADYMRLVERFSHLSERYRLIGGDNYQAELERTLLGLGFEPADLDRPTKEFSGGWRMRIELAKILLQRPDILLLDEPTNHLDIESIAWLEQQLVRSGCSVVLVSHDRVFLNRVTQRTMEISCGRLYDYRVAYDDFVRLRTERREQQLRAYENQQKEIADIKDFIERFRYKPTKAVQVQSRIKQLNKIVPIEIDDVERDELHLKFPPCLRSGDYPLVCDDVSKSYGDHCVFRHVGLTLRRGDKVAFVGKNGEGKSTLVKCIMREIDHDGTLKIAQNVQIGYYAQNQAQLLDDNLTVYETIDQVATGDVRLHLRDILGAFMFGGPASDKKVKVLSGGERSRLAMIRLLLQPVNFLILDEPTNHLDMRTKDVLKEALLAFDGTLIVVSHDRGFLDGLATRIYEFHHATVSEHIGDIYDYLRKKQLDDLRDYNTYKSDPQPAEAEPPSQGKQSYEAQKEQQRLLRRAEKRVAEAEAAVADKEQAIAALEEQIATPEGASDSQLAQDYVALQKELEAAMAEWEAAEEDYQQTKAI